ncbi:MAG: efflux RND transporter periplasmic adaptor subunit, partial [bacterium]
LEQAKAAYASAKAREELAKSELKQATQELDRMRGLVERGLGSTSDLEKAQTARDVDAARLGSAEQDVVDAKAGVDNAQEELERTVIRAEIPGVVVRLAVEKGENVLAGDLYNRGSSVVTVADLSEMEAQILVDETEVVHVHDGQKAKVEVDAFPDKEIAGSVFEVGNSAYEAGALGSQEAKDFRVRILLENFPEALRPGLSARAQIVTDTRDSVLAVPIEALALRDPRKEAEKLQHKHGHAGKPKAGAAADSLLARADSAVAAADSARGIKGDEETTEVEGVFVVRDGKAVFTPVKTGISGKRHFEVMSGLRPGDVVVRGPFDALRRLASGDKVRERKEKEGASKAPKGKGDREGEDGS